MKNFIYNLIVFVKYLFNSKKIAFNSISLNFKNCEIHKKSKVYAPAKINDVKIGAYTYISPNSNISKTVIGKFNSIGPNFICGYGIHPVNSISTSPVFYTKKGIENISFSKNDTFETRKEINIGNDVFIGANVTILDGVTIGNGAVIGAGAVVIKDVPEYAIAVGVPAKVVKFRFSDSQIEKFQNIKWWNWTDEELLIIEKYNFKIDEFLTLHEEKN